MNKERIKPHEKALIWLLSSGLFDKPLEQYITDNIWGDVAKEASIQYVAPIAYWGLKKAHTRDTNFAPPDDIVDQWRSTSVLVALRNELLMKAQDEVLSILRENKIGCAIIKGSSLSVLYPLTNMRALGDIDILIFDDKIAKAVELLIADGYMKHDSDPGFHVGMTKQGISVELHYSICKRSATCRGIAIISFMLSAPHNIRTEKVDLYSFPVLDISHQAVVLLVHMQRHMYYTGIGLRQLCDWALFIYRNSEAFFTYQHVLIDCGLMNFAKAITKVCVVYLGLSYDLCLWCKDYDDEMSTLLMLDIISSGNRGSRKSEPMLAAAMIRADSQIENETRSLVLFSHNIHNIARDRYPICTRIRFLTPVCSIIVIIKSVFRMLLGKREMVSISKLIITARRKKSLYRALGISEFR